MNKTSAAVGSTIFFFVAPFVVAGVVPWWISGWQIRWSSPIYLPLAIVGAGLALAGLAGLLDSFRRFAFEGEGTPAPVAPTKRLVVRGPYRYVRNPMYVGVLALILGQALLFGSVPLIVYSAAVWLLFHLFVIFHEEPTLLSAYGEEYEAFRASVPRWIPRLRPVATP